jgi:hypothetical protein
MVARDGIEPPTPAFSGLVSATAERILAFAFLPADDLYDVFRVDIAWLPRQTSYYCGIFVGNTVQQREKY